MRADKIEPPDTHAGVAEQADAQDLKSCGRKAVWVRSPPPALSPNQSWPRRVAASEDLTTDPVSPYCNSSKEYWSCTKATVINGMALAIATAG